MKQRLSALLLATLLASTALMVIAPPAAALDCTPTLASLCAYVINVITCSDTLSCVCSDPPCVTCDTGPVSCEVCVNSACRAICVGCPPLNVGDCAPPEVGVVIGTRSVCVDPTPPTSAGTTCPAAYGGGKGLYLDYGPAGASSQDKYFCATAAPSAFAPCPAPGEQVVIVSNIGGAGTYCAPPALPGTCGTLTPNTPGWSVGVGGTCVAMPWITGAPPGACPAGTTLPLRIWWGATPGSWPTSTDLCLG
jgi:hypothetical protein